MTPPTMIISPVLLASLAKPPPPAPLSGTQPLKRLLVASSIPVAFGAFGGVAVLVLIVSFVVPASGRGLHDRVAGSMVVALPREETT